MLKKREIMTCDICKHDRRPDQMIYLEYEGIHVCDDCCQYYYEQCCQCESYVKPEELSDIREDGLPVCKRCSSVLYRACRKCAFVWNIDELEVGLCEECTLKELENGLGI